MPKKVRQGLIAGFTLDGANPWQLPGVEFVRALRQIKLADGREVSAFSVNERRGGAHDPNHLSAGHSQEIAGTMLPKLPPGNYVLTFLIDAGVLDSQTVPRMVFDKPGQARNWPHGRARWTEQISLPLTILPADQSPVQIVTDSNLDPRAAIQITAVRVTLSGAGRLLSLDISIRNCHIPCSFDTVLRVADKEYPIGPVSTGGGGEWSLRTSGKVPSFPANIGSADVFLRPNPSLVEGRFGFDRIWGDVIVIKNVPMQRYDLEAASQSAAPDGPP